MKHTLVTIIALFLLFPHPGKAQDDAVSELPFEVNRVYPAFSITKEKLKEARTLIDLNRHYKPSWVRSYNSVEILTTNNGIVNKTAGKSDTLTGKQKEFINTADPGTDISVYVQYIPENSLKVNEPKVFEFTLKVDPDHEAQFDGGYQLLNQYLKEYAIDKIPEGSFKNFDMSAVKFTINEEGQIIDAHIFWPSEREEIDALLLETICNMPTWKPAAYDNGLKVKQEFALTVGSMENCVINLLNIRKN